MIRDDAFFEFGRNGTVGRAPIAPGFFGQNSLEAPHTASKHSILGWLQPIPYFNVFFDVLKRL